MIHLSMRRRSRGTALAALLVPAFLLGACGDDDDGPSGPGEPDVNGTWQFMDDGQPNYVRITDNTIEIFDNTGNCFFEIEHGIESVDGDVFVVDTGGATVEWTIEEVGSNIVIEDDEGISTTLTPSSVNTSTLTSCEPFDPDVDDFAHPVCTSLPQLAVPGSVEGEIEPGDARFWDDSWVDVYRIQLTEETDVSITMAADNQDELDAYLSIYDATGTEIVDDDDAADGSDSRAEATLGPGCYFVTAGSYSGDDPGETGGGYTLTASTEFVFVFPPAPCEELPEITVGSSISSELVEGDLRWNDDTWYEAYSLQLDTEQTVTISQTADDTELLDPYLLLYEAAGVVGEDIAESDDIDDVNFNSQIADITLAPGCYIVVAGSWMGNSEDEVGGDYTLEVD